MDNLQRFRPCGLIGAAAVLWLATTGCTAHRSGKVVFLGPENGTAATEPQAQPAPQSTTPPADIPSGPLTLQQLVITAMNRHPDLAIAQARAEAARGQFVQAGLYPNPTVAWSAEEMGQRPGAAGFQGPVFAQDFVTANKLAIAQAAAARDVEATDWQIISRRFDLLTRVRTAYFDVLSAQLAIEENEKIIKLAEDSLNAAKKLQAAGGGIKPDVLRAEIELSQSRIRLAIAQQGLTTSWKLLANTVGVADLPARALDGKLDQPAPRYEWQSAVNTMLQRSADLRGAQARVEQAQARLDLAQAEVCPNVNLKLRPFYTFAEKRMELTVEAGVALPIFNRNQGNIRTAQADLARAGEEARLLELQLVDRLANAFQRYENARNQTEKYRTEILPKARQARDAVQLGYQAGAGDTKFDYTSVLQAQQTYVQAQLAYIQSLNDVWRAVSEIAGLLQQDDW